MKYYNAIEIGVKVISFYAIYYDNKHSKPPPGPRTFQADFYTPPSSYIIAGRNQ